MQDWRLCAILNELLEAEQRALLPRLVESSAFFTSDRASGWQRVGRMLAERDQHLNRLAEAIIELGGAPAPRAGDISSADFHYVNLHVLLPRVVASHEELCRLYDRAIQALADSPQVVDLVSDIAARHHGWLEDLRQLATASAPTQNVNRGGQDGG